MMNLVPPVGWGEVATRTELVALGGGLRAEMSVLGSELRGELGELRAEMSVLGSELRGEIKAGNAELRGEIKAANSEMLRTLFFAMVASNATLVGLVFAAIKLA